MHHNCIRRCKIHSPTGIFDWIFSTARDEHSGLSKEAPSRQNGAPIRGIKGPVKIMMSNLMSNGTSGPLRVYTMLRDGKSESNLPILSRKKIKNYIQNMDNKKLFGQTATHDLITWSIPKLATNAASFKKQKIEHQQRSTS